MSTRPVFKAAPRTRSSWMSARPFGQITQIAPFGAIVSRSFPTPPTDDSRLPPHNPRSVRGPRTPACRIGPCTPLRAPRSHSHDRNRFDGFAEAAAQRDEIVVDPARESEQVARHEAEERIRDESVLGDGDARPIPLAREVV